MKYVVVWALLVGASSASLAAAVPAEIARQLPRGYSVINSAPATVGRRKFYLVALRSREEQDSRSYLGNPGRALARPLIIYERTPRVVTQVGRNDYVIDRAGDAGLAGNGCDPFGDRKIAVKGSYFTVENGISCGAHWTDYVTFRFDPRLGYVFDNSRFESRKLNPSDASKSKALISDAPHIRRGSALRPVPFAKWRPR